jgi:hypothetical protein
MRTQNGSLPESATIFLDAGLAPDKNQLVIEVKTGQTILEALAALNIRLSQPVIAVVTGAHYQQGIVVDLMYNLAPGNHVRLVPQIAGG